MALSLLRQVMNGGKVPSHRFLFLWAGILLTLASAAVRADDRYFLMLFAYDGDPYSAPFSPEFWGHTFALVVRVGENRRKGSIPTAAEWVIKERYHISWLPKGGEINASRAFSEDGINPSVPETLKNARKKSHPLWRTAAYPITASVFSRFRNRSLRLSSVDPGYEYIVDDRGTRNAAGNCMHAISDTFPEYAPLQTRAKHGVSGAQAVLAWLYNQKLIKDVSGRTPAMVAERLIDQDTHFSAYRPRLFDLATPVASAMPTLRPHAETPRGGFRQRLSSSH